MKLNIIGTIPFTSSTCSTDISISTTSDGLVYDPAQSYQEFIPGFKTYEEGEYDYTTSQGRTKVAQAIGIKDDGSKGESAIDPIRSLIIPA